MISKYGKIIYKWGDEMFDEGYIVCDSKYQRKILKDLNSYEGFMDYKLISLSELKRKLTFNIKDEGIPFLVREYKVFPEVAKAYIDSLYQLNGRLDNDKGNMLMGMYEALNRNGFVEIDRGFQKVANNLHFTFYGYNQTKELEYVIALLNKDNVKIVPREYNVKNSFEINSFSSIETEVAFIFARIHELILDGVSPRQIKLANVSSDYSFLLNRYASSYKICINNKPVSNVLPTSFAKDFFSLIELGDIRQIMSELNERYGNDSFYVTLVKQINRYGLYNYDTREMVDFYRYIFKSMTYETQSYDNAIELIALDEISEYSTDYVFILDFNISIPRVIRDEDYLNDKEKEYLDIDTSLYLNSFAKDDLMYNLSQVTNLTITFSSMHSFNSAIISALSKENPFKVVDYPNDYYPIGHEKIGDDIYLSNACDNLIKYNDRSKLLEDNYYNELAYANYDNKYKPINPDKVKAFINGPIKLSYSSMHSFKLCPFSYYAQNILKIEAFNETFDTHLGTYAHNILRDYECQKDNFNFDVSCQNHRKDFKGELGPKEQFYVEKMEKHLKTIIEQIEKHKKHTALKKAHCEKQMDVVLNDGNLIFKGFIDKLWYDDIDNNRYVAIIDYKTGNDEAKLDNLEYGQNLQLPVYIYLLRNNPDFKDTSLVGFYLHKINIINPSYIPDKTDDEQKAKNSLLEGFTNPDLVEYIDDTKGDYLKKYSTKNDGTYSKASLVFDKTDEARLLELVESTIDEVYHAILKADFKIQPKLVDKKNISCTYCEFKDVCFKTVSDNLYLDSKPFKEKEVAKDEDE